MVWRDNPVIHSVEKPEIKYCFSGLDLAWQSLVQDISAYQQDLEKGQPAVREQIMD